MIETLQNIIHTARRFKLATIFNMLGLVVAFATLYVLMAQIGHELSYNHGLEDYKRLYRLETDIEYNEWEFSDLVCRPFADALADIPQIESYSMVMIQNGNPYYYMLPIRKGDITKNYFYSICNNTGVSALTNRFVDGRIEWVDNDTSLYSIIIPASIAMDYFGTTQAADSMMQSYKVLGVYEDFPENSEFGSWNRIYFNIGDFDICSDNSTYKCVLKLKEPTNDVEALSNVIKQAIMTHLDNLGWENFLGSKDIETEREAYHKGRFKLTPLTDSYFENSSFSYSKRGYFVMLVIVGLACLLLIIIATINFLNFTLAESPMRVRGLNTRLVLGDSRHRLRQGLVWECVVTSVLASLIALLLCAAIAQLPRGSWTLTEGSISPFSHWLLSLSLIAIAAIIGVAAGTYPAVFATSFTPAIVLKGNYALTPQGKKLRTALVCTQLCFSMLMVIYIGVLVLQNNYIFNSSGSHNTQQILTTYLPFSEDSASNDRLYQALKNLPEVEAISFSNGPISTVDGHETKSTSEGDILVKYSLMSADTAYMHTRGLKIIEGRGFRPYDKAAAIINEAARKKWGRMKPGVKISTSSDYQNDSAVVVGVCEDFRFGTTRISSHEPFIFLYETDKPRDYLNVLLATDIDNEKAFNKVQSVVQQHYDNNNVQLKYFDDNLHEAYQNELRYFRQLYLLSIACLLITLVGVFCLTVFEMEYRRKEIGIRKVLGATTGEVVGMFCRRYGWLLLISFIIAAPLAYIAGQMTLAHFAEHVSIHQWLWLFPVGLLAVAIVTMGTVVLQSWRSARENPVNSIKTE